MSSAATSLAPKERLAVLFDEIAELCGQRNAIDGRLVEIAAEIERDELCGMTGARSMPALMSWKTGVSPRNAETVVAVARRLEEFPDCAQGLREGRFSLDQVGVIAERAADGSDEHYAELAQSATVAQLRTAIKLAPHPDPEPRPKPEPAFTATSDAHGTTYRIRLTALEAAKFDAARKSHQDALVADWTREHGADNPSDQAPPFPTAVDGFLSLIESGWDTEVARRPHGQHTTVVVHVDVKDRVAALHLGPVLSDADRQYLTCDATCEVWFEHDGRAIGAGRATRTIGRRLRRALEHRDRTCVVPGCAATRGLHAHPHPPLGTRRPHRPRQPRPTLPPSPPGPSPRPDHHQRPGRPPRRHRHRGSRAPTRLPGQTTHAPRARRRTLQRPDRRTRPMVVVPTLRTTA